MREIVLNEWMTLDGVVQSPSSPDEDASGGFRSGGWHPQFLEKESERQFLHSITSAGGYLFGRGTYEIFAAHWPDASLAEQPLADPLNSKPKWVVSSSLNAPLAWENSTLLGPDFIDEIAELKNRNGESLHVFGSPQLAKALLAAGLVDRLQLMIDPILVGGGKRLFGADQRLTQFTLASSQQLSTGAILLTYEAT